VDDPSFHDDFHQEPPMSAESEQEDEERTIRVITKIRRGHSDNMLVIERSELTFDKEGRLIKVEREKDGTIVFPGNLKFEGSLSY
jgi:hypothetical protein